jgi:RHS repeat-associated protein
MADLAQSVDTLDGHAGGEPGGDVPELRLGQTSDPAQLIHGDPAAIRASASRLRTFSLAFGRTADGLAGLDTGHWTGRGAGAFREKFTPQPAGWRGASSAAGSAGGALESYANAVEAAQGMARQAIDLHAAGQEATVSARAAYREHVRSFNRAAQVYNTRLAGGTDPGPRPAEPPAFTDPGASLRAEAEQILGRARWSRDKAATRTETTIKIATREAPAPAPDGALGASGTLGASGDGAAAGLSDAAGKPAAGARSPSDIPWAGDSVDAATGDVLLFQDDVSLPAGSGVLPLVIGRAYRSSRRAGRWFGPSWASTFDQRLQVSQERITGLFADGRVLSWPAEAGEDGQVPATGLPVTGPRRRLRRLREGGFAVTDPQAGLTWRFDWRPGYFRSSGEIGELPLVSVTDRAGHQVSLGYTPAGEPAWIRHSGGYRIRVVMSGGRLSKLMLAGAGAEVPLVEYRYDPAGNLAAVINSSGEPLRFSYDEEGRLLGRDDRNGASCRYSYDEQGRCVAGPGADGLMSGGLAYGDRVTWWTDAAGAVTTYQVDESSRVAAVTDPVGNVTHFWYDEYGRTVTRGDALGRLTRYEYDEPGNLTCITRPDDSQVRLVYDEASLPVCLQEPDGAAWNREYDARGNLVRQIAPDGTATSYGYDERGHLASIAGPLGAATLVESDPAGFPVAVTSPGGGITRYTRDLFGRVTSITGPGGGVTELTWTVEGRLASRTCPDGTTERLAYDADGNLISRLSPAGEQTSYEYGPVGLVTATTSQEGVRTEFRYDHGLRLTTSVQAGLTWQYSYDPAGRLVTETDANGASTRYSYDAAGQLTGLVSAAGQQIACGYDELGHLIECVADGVVTTFGYDAAGRLVLASNPDAQIRLSRDPLGRITAESCGDRTVTSEYDGAGRRSRRVTGDGSQLCQQRWEYDDAGNPVRLETGGQELRFGYDRAGREIRRDLPGGLTLTQEWSAAGRLTSQILTTGEQSLARRAYTYQADGFLAGLDDQLTGPRRFALDPAGRITSAKGPGWAERYGYDPSGNVSSARWVAPPPSAAGSWLADDVQGARERAGTLITKAGAIGYQHDERGRVIRRQRPRAGRPAVTWTFQWDAGDRLTAVTTPDGSTWRYKYDPLGRRIAKQRLNPSGGVTEETTFTWDGAFLTEALTRRADRQRRMAWDYLPGTGAPLTQSETLSPSDAPQLLIAHRFYAILTDHLGTPAELVSPDGAVAGYQQHTLLGGTLWHPGGTSTPLRLAGQYYDRETGLHYHVRGYYDPVTGSYLTPEPPGLLPVPDPHGPGELSAVFLAAAAGIQESNGIPDSPGSSLLI